MKRVRAWAGINGGKIRWEIGLDCDFPYLPIFKHKKDCQLDHYDSVVEVEIRPITKRKKK